jgi:hypothetical protein
MTRVLEVDSIRLLQLSVLLLGIPLLWAASEAAQQITQQKTARDQEKERAAIGQTLERFLDAWNKHDAHANAMSFTGDADSTNVLGILVHGR